ncbi:MAG: SDR family oxidoreductase [Alphaproteobacteria bacterium]
MYRSEGEAVASKIGGIYRHLEISSEITVDTAFDFVRDDHGVERVLINCAGVALDQPAVWRDQSSGKIMIHDVPSFERLLQVNLTGTFYTTIKSNSASVASEDGLEGQAAYAASEGGVLALTRPLARDLVNEGVRIATIMSGRYDTAMFTERSEDMTEKVGTHKRDPEGLADPNEFADLVMRIIEDDDINGQWVRMNAASKK